MKKNQNILNYLEKYKKKHHIFYTDETSGAYKNLAICFKVAWIYSFAMLALSLLSSSLNYLNIKKGGFYFPNYVLVPTIIAAVIMLAVPILFKLKLKEIACVLALAIQPFLYFGYKKLWRYGLGYYTKFYWAIVVPAILVAVFSIILLAILLYGRYRKNQLYSEIISNLYRQYGTQDGKKLSASEWDEFLDNYSPETQTKEKKK